MTVVLAKETVPVTVIVPPFKPVPATRLVTVPALPDAAAIVMAPGLFVMVTLEPAVKVLSEYLLVLVLPIKSCPFVGAVVKPVPPRET